MMIVAGVRHIQPALDDRGANQHVVLAAEEVEHHALKLVLAQLAVAHADLGLGTSCLSLSAT